MQNHALSDKPLGETEPMTQEEKDLWDWAVDRVIVSERSHNRDPMTHIMEDVERQQVRN